MKNQLESGPWVYIISLVEKSLAFEWFFRDLRQHHKDIYILFINPSKPELMQYCEMIGYKTKWIPYSGKKDILPAFFKILFFFFKSKPALVHAHLFDASIIGLTAAKILGIKKRIHSRHHASHHHLYFPHAVKYDRWVNSMSTKIFAISESIRNLLIKEENVNQEKIQVVHHGFDFNFFAEVNEARILSLKSKYGIDGKSPVIGMISRYTHWKGIQYVIPAFVQLLKEYPDALLILANANGDYEKEIKELLKSLPQNSFLEIKFETDSPALYKLFDLFIHVPIDDHSEAFGQVYIEALVAKLPCIFTNSGIAAEFVIHEKNAFLVPYCDTPSIFIAMKRILGDSSFALQMAETGSDEVKAKFGLPLMIDQTLKGYE